MSRMGKSSSPSPRGSQAARTSRAPLGVRIALIAAAVVLAAAACVAAVNLAAVLTFNAATRSLQENLASASEETVDYDTLSALQEQTDAQFDEANTFRPLLLSQIREAIDANRETSYALTVHAREQLDQQQNGSSDDDTDSSDQDSTDTKQGGGLTEEQRAQVEELLQSNQPSSGTQDSDASDSDGSSDETGGTTGTQTAKPW
ncbi:cell surface protein [Bifidobacterium lemurum]|uniref:Cell surface protein n=1 Tax=Bifidobacterium lemurum TaxID=1603886 RepID=A0A261FSX4_9BIFI|nr:DUF6466 family protein [Bifidobacterium lemurum]OZG62294.1 cell surface protein [Bifidobacterium lemurum]QOL33660.1 cell surface protein [Bifidobacterium lemurum]